MQVYSNGMQTLEKIWDIVVKVMVIVIIIMVIIGIGLSFTPKVKQMHVYQKRSEQLQKKIEQTLAEEKQSQIQQRRFATDSNYVEKVAHEVGYAHEDELIFHFPNSNELDEATP